MIIEGSFGLGEAVVSGSVTPDSYTVLKNPLKIKNVYVSEKKFGIFRNDKGENYEKHFSKHEAEKQVLTEEMVLSLAKLSLDIERHYGKPQDIEWAIEKGKIYITQSRPITTLK
jgi:pyruvate,water dikinase